jgi:flagellar motor switch protein FliM
MFPGAFTAYLVLTAEPRLQICGRAPAQTGNPRCPLRFSAFLRTYLTVKLVSVEQLSYVEFLDGLSSPTCLVSLGLSPYDGSAVRDLNPSLTFPIIEMLLGGSGKTRAIITEIEQKVLDGLFRIVLQDLREAWKTGYGDRVRDRVDGERAAACGTDSAG